MPLTEEIERYAERHSSPADDTLNEVYRKIWFTTATPHQSSTQYQGRLLEMLSRMKAPRLAVEIGAFMGYSAICIARGLATNGILHTIEANEEYEQPIRENLKRCGVEDKVVLHLGDAKQIMDKIPEGIEFAFIDADKLSYPTYYDIILPKMQKGGIMIFDNMLWYGNVLNPTDAESQAIAALNKKITEDPSTQNILLPIRDGLMLCQVI